MRVCAVRWAARAAFHTASRLVSSGMYVVTDDDIEMAYAAAPPRTLMPTAPVLAPVPAFRFPALCQPAASSATGKRPERDGTTSRYFEASCSAVDANASDDEEALMAAAEDDEIMCTLEMQTYHDERARGLQRRNAYLAGKRARRYR